MALTDLTRISTSGIATGTSLSGAILHGDAHFRGTQVGVTSALFDSSDDALEFNDNVKLTFGNDGDLQLYHDSVISRIRDQGTGILLIESDDIKLGAVANGYPMLIARQGFGVTMMYNGNTKFETTNHGAVVTGILTATSFSGPIVGNTNNTSGISTFYDLRVSNNLTVEGTTTTLDTNLIGVDRVEVGANSNTVTGIAVTQSGTADIVRLYDGASQVVTVDDTGNVGLGSAIPSTKLDVNGDITIAEKIIHAGNSNTFISFSGDDTFAIDTAGAERFEINSGGTGRFKGGALLLTNGRLNVNYNIAHSSTYYLDNDAHILVSNGDSAGTKRSVLKLGGEAALVYGGGSSSFIIADRQNERLRITSDGDIEFGVRGSPTAVTSGNIKHISLGKDYWNGDKGHYNALRLLVYDNGLNDAYGLGISNGELEIQSQGHIGIYAGSGASDSKRDRRFYIDSSGDVIFGYNTSGSVNSSALFNMSLGGTYHNTNGAYPKLSLWHDGTDHMGFGVSPNQLDYILTSSSYDHVFYGGNAGTTELLRIKGDSGGVGIGTDNPTQKLEVYSGHTGRPTFRHSGGFGGVQIAGPQNASGASLMFTRGYDVVGGGTTTYSMFLAGNTQGLHFISGDPSEYETKTRLFLSSAGKVGIGTDNPTSHLQVYRKTQFANNPIIQARSNNGSTNELKFEIDGDGDAYFNGKVGIGTDNPQEILHIHEGDIVVGQDSGNSTNTRNYIKFGRVSGVKAAIGFINDSGNGRGDIIFMNNNDSNSSQFADSDEVLRINKNGYVNIGSGTAEEQLTIRNTTQHCLIRIISANNSSAGVDFGDPEDTDIGRVRYYHSDGSNTNYMRFDTNGSEKLRITSSGQLIIQSGGIDINTAGTGIFYNPGDATATGFNFLSNEIRGYTKNTQRISLRSDGSVRIYGGDDNCVHSMSNNWHGNQDFDHRPSSGRRVLTSNGAGWRTGVDGADPILSLTSSADTGRDPERGQNYGLLLHTESQADNAYAPMIGFANRSNSGSYNTTFAAILAKKIGQATDANWSTGQLEFYTNKPVTLNNGYMTNVPDMSISQEGYVNQPRQPAFHANGQAASPHNSSGGQNMNLSEYMVDVITNIGNHYKTSGTDQGKFVAPIAGNYFFYGQALLRQVGDGIGSGELTFYKNGSNVAARALGYTFVTEAGEGTAAYGTDHDSLKISCILTLAVGDKVHLQSLSTASGVDWYWGSGLGNFGGYLIG